jgi:hypothetical protein
MKNGGNFFSEIDCVSEAVPEFEVKTWKKEVDIGSEKAVLGDPYQNCLLIHVRVDAAPECFPG